MTQHGLPDSIEEAIDPIDATEFRGDTTDLAVVDDSVRFAHRQRTEGFQRSMSSAVLSPTPVSFEESRTAAPDNSAHTVNRRFDPTGTENTPR